MGFSWVSCFANLLFLYPPKSNCLNKIIYIYLIHTSMRKSLKIHGITLSTHITVYVPSYNLIFLTQSSTSNLLRLAFEQLSLKHLTTLFQNSFILVICTEHKLTLTYTSRYINSYRKLCPLN